MAPRVVIVTGASRGIGLSISRLLLQTPQSCNLVVVARSSAPLEALAQEAGGEDRVRVLAGDLGDMSLGARAVELALQSWGRLDALVLNHGQIEPVERVVNADLEGWRRGFEINVFSYVAMVKAAIPALRASKGRVVFTSSGAAVKDMATWGCYGATKAVVNHLAKTVAKEEPDITVVAVRPGVVNTQMQSTIAEHYGTMEAEDAEVFRKLKEEGKMLRPEQPGNVMARLALGAPKELSGEFLNWNDAGLSSFQDAE